MRIKWEHMLLRLQRPREDMGKGEALGYTAEEGGKVETEGNGSLSRGGLGGLGRRAVGPPLPPDPHSRLGSSTSHVFWNLPPPRGVGRWPCRGFCLGQARGCFLSCWPHLCSVRGRVPQAFGMCCRELRRLDTQRVWWSVVAHPAFPHCGC